MPSILTGFYADGALAKLKSTNLINNNEQFENNLEDINKALPQPKK
ncbi:hypothetical protein [Cytobacillus purgationiresistens]|uniref:Uncharacterized protein n=1 Tax=Cytobacillus purgationiresistens TaxID=863449 RepID=A0ABU0AJK2_9BACI|nr:hypothetical protein [Cytobacillus purgationiresistens]MDQ0271449.1 hypothetical protein [Cytobacillus purgationiresistens]